MPCGGCARRKAALVRVTRKVLRPAVARVQRAQAAIRERLKARNQGSP